MYNIIESFPVDPRSLIKPDGTTQEFQFPAIATVKLEQDARHIVDALNFYIQEVECKGESPYASYHYEQT